MGELQRLEEANEQLTLKQETGNIQVISNNFFSYVQLKQEKDAHAKTIEQLIVIKEHLAAQAEKLGQFKITNESLVEQIKKRQSEKVEDQAHDERIQNEMHLGKSM